MKNADLQRSKKLARMIAALAVTAAGVPLSARAQDDDVAAAIEAVRVATERYADVNVALADGYIPDPSGHCVSAAAEGLPAEWGGMGLHYIHPARLGLTAAEPRVDGTGLSTDFAAPSILLYEPQADGSLRLVGAENLIFEAAWIAAGKTGAPESFGREWDYMADDPTTEGDEAHGFQPHFDQHVWFVDSPAGNLLPFTPSVSCDHVAALHDH